MALLVAQYNEKIDVFSPSFLKDGFCLSNQDKSIWLQSHCLSFYIDTVYAVFLWLLTSYCTKGMPESHYLPVKANIIGTFGHGCGHLYAALRDNYDGELTLYAMNKDSTGRFASSYTIILFFWFGLTIPV